MPGDERDLELHLKLLADAALVGLPNAGKSSLLTRISNARPKVAEYPFTTLQPVLGTVDAPDGRQLVVADVPGLIEGASEGVGLGHEFLAHLERARMLVHVIDASKPVEEQWRTIDAELAAYGAGLDERPQIVVLNKLDLLPEPPAFEVEDDRVLAVFALSCATGAGARRVPRRLFALVPEPAGRGRADDELAEFLVYRPEPKARAWRLLAHRPRLPRRRHAAERGGARARAPRRRRAQRRRGRGRRGELRARPLTRLRTLRRLLRPAARRPRRARARGEGGARPRPRARARRRRPGPQADRDAGRGAARARARGVPRRRGRPRRPRAHRRPAARPPRVGRPGLPRRRRRVRRLPGLEGAGRGAAPRAPRRRDAAGLPARAPRRDARPPRRARSACSSSSSSRTPISSHELRAAPRARRRRRRRDPARRARGSSSATASTAAAPVHCSQLDVDRTGTPHRGARAGQARERRRHPRHAAGLLVHRLLRRVHREQPAADEGDLGRGARAAEEGATACSRARSPARPRRRGSSPTTSTSCCTSSRRRRATSTGSRTSGATCPRRRPKRPRPERPLSAQPTRGYRGEGGVDDQPEGRDRRDRNREDGARARDRGLPTGRRGRALRPDLQGRLVASSRPVQVGTAARRRNRGSLLHVPTQPDGSREPRVHGRRTGRVRRLLPGARSVVPDPIHRDRWVARAASSRRAHPEQPAARRPPGK